MVYIFDCIYVPAHQITAETLQHDYGNTVTGLCQIEQNVRFICRYTELLKSDYSLTGM